MLNWQVTACLGALLLFSCGTTHHAAVETGPRMAGVELINDALPALPADGPLRAVNIVEPLVRQGIDALSHSGNLTFGATSLSLQPDAGHLSFAVYRFHVGAFPFESIDFVITPNDLQRTWYGLADYDRGRWLLYQAEAEMNSLPHPGQRIVSTNGYCYFVVIGFDDADTVIQQISIDLDVPSWGELTLADTDHAGEALSMAQFGNLLQIAYSANDIEEVKLARATSLAPTMLTDWTFSQITTNTVTDAIDLEPVNDLPAVAYLHSQSGTCRFARALNTTPAGMGDWVFALPPLTALDGYVSLADVGGNPAVAYVDPGVMFQSVEYVYSSVPDPSINADWTVTEAVTNGMSPPFADFSHVSLFSYEGLPTLTYYNEHNNQLHFLRGETAAPLDFNDWDAGAVDAAGAGFFSQGSQFGMLPVLVYVDQSNGALLYRRAADWTPGAPEDWSGHVIDAGGTVSGPVSLQRLNLGLAVAYRDTTSEAVRYAWFAEGTPGSGLAWRVVTVAENTGSGPVSLVIMPNQLPAIAYYNSNTAALVFAWMEE